ncbi:MAG: DUF3047 domain-containing protein [Gammaproteobacteria bacterium]|nr:DUF3047 domain-containing protein [Gammaproteobacteria bacterium]
MKKFCAQLLVSFAIFLYAGNLLSEVSGSESLGSESSEKAILLNADNFEHIEFKRIKSSDYTYQGQQLRVAVDGGASFLMQAFDHVRLVSKVSFEWRSEGLPQTIDAKQEEKRAGDDAVFKLGLLLESDDSSLNPFLPSWMKRVEALLKHPSEDMIYLVAGAKHKPGIQWLNPYNKRVLMIAVDSIKDQHGWQQSSYHFDVPVKVVAIWLMSDGDNTGSQFTAHIKNISIE